MLHVFFGTDTIEVRKNAYAFLNDREAAEGEIKEVTPENYEEGILTDLAGGAGLFWSEEIILLDTPSEKKDFYEDVFSNLALLEESPNTFVLIEGGLKAPEKKKLAKHAETVEETAKGKEERFNVFTLTDALLRRDKKSLWILLTKAKHNNLSAEEIIGTLFWQIKMLRLAERTKDAAEAGEKPFVYNKAKRALKLFKEGELDRLSRELLTVYHEGHLGKHDIDLALEKWVLRM